MSNEQQNQEICCSKFNPAPWDQKEIIWQDKLFVKDCAWAFLHIPLNFGQVITRMWKKIEDAQAGPEKKDWLMLTYDPSFWKSEQFVAVTKEVPDMENVKISGKFLTKVFESPYSQVKNWHKEMIDYAKSKNLEIKKVYFYYTTCPKCAKVYSKNYIVGFVQVG